MTDQQRAVYYAELSVVQKDEVVGVLLAALLGTFGAHHFYLRKTGLGILYCFLSVTGFSTIAGFVEAFFMPERIRLYNAAQAAAVAAHLGFAPPVGAFTPAGAPGSIAPGYVASAPVAAAPIAAGVNSAGPAAFSTAATTYSPVSGTLPGPESVCSSCGATVAGGVKFCSRCGAAVQP
jgi:TM2 domain-containing membrane protein YozV